MSSTPRLAPYVSYLMRPITRLRTAYAARPIAWNTALAVTGSILAVMAQIQFDQHRLAWRWMDWQGPAAVGLVGMVAFGLATQGVAMEKPKEESLPVAWARLLPPALAGLLLSLASVPWFTDNTIELPGLLLLAAGVSLVLLGLGRATPGPAPNRAAGFRALAQKGLAWEWVALLAIVALGVALRLYNLENLPAELSLDQISKFWDVRDVLLGRRTPIFFEANQGREGMFFYLIALVSQFTGLGFMAMKLSSALVGIITIPALYLLGRELAGREVALLAASLLAISKWHVILSRLGYRAILAPLFVILVLYFLARGLRRGRLVDYGWAGVMLGLGLYTYKAFPFVVPAALSGAALYALRGDRRPLLGGLVVLIMALAVFVPMGVYAVESWDDYLYRENLQREFLEEHYAASELTVWEGYLINTRKTALMNNFIADPLELYNPPHERFFGPISAAMLILGLGYLLTRLGEGRNGLLLVFLFWLVQAVILPMFPPWEWANSLRAAPTIGPGLLVAALSLPALRRFLAGAAERHLRPLALTIQRDEPAPGEEATPVARLRLRPARLANLLLALLLVLVMGLELVENCRSVFVRYPAAQNLGGYPLAREIAGEIRDWLGVAPVYVKYSMQGINIQKAKVYLTSWGLGDEWDPDRPDSPGGYQIDTIALDEPPLSRDDLMAAVFILYPEHYPGDLAPLEARYPAHFVAERRRPDGELAYVVFVGHE